MHIFLMQGIHRISKFPFWLIIWSDCHTFLDIFTEFKIAFFYYYKPAIFVFTHLYSAHWHPSPLLTKQHFWSLLWTAGLYRLKHIKNIQYDWEILKHLIICNDQKKIWAQWRMFLPHKWWTTYNSPICVKKPPTASLFSCLYLIARALEHDKID